MVTVHYVTGFLFPVIQIRNKGYRNIKLLHFKNAIKELTFSLITSEYAHLGFNAWLLGIGDRGPHPQALHSTTKLCEFAVKDQGNY